jgi:NAD(P)-dependent dehydrogenase (short-subunit alcohol dehydrogenase family)
MGKQPVAIVTGGGQGIGRGIAATLLGAGYRVGILALDDEAGRETEAELGENLRFFRCDVSDEAAVQRAVAAVVDSFGRLDGLVNNAANPVPHSGPIEELSLEAWRRITALNLDSVFLCTKYAVPALRAAGGAIVNIASVRALQSEPHGEAYSATKGALIALTHALATSLGPDVRVNAVSPGRVPVSEWKKKSVRRAFVAHEDDARAPLGRVGQPTEIGELVAFLLSDKASFITGQNIVADGGMGKRIFYPGQGG